MRQERVSSTNKVHPSYYNMECFNLVEDTRLQGLVSKESSIYHPDEVEISSEVHAGNSSLDFTEQDDKVELGPLCAPL